MHHSVKTYKSLGLSFLFWVFLCQSTAIGQTSFYYALTSTPSVLIEPSCDYYTGEVISLTSNLSGQEGAFIYYFLTDDNGEILQGPLAAPTFGTLNAGGYLAYAVTSDSTMLFDSNISTVRSTDPCIAISDAFEMVVCYSDIILQSEDVTANMTNSGSGNCFVVLTDNAGIILNIENNSSANFGSLAPDEYFLYSFCSSDGTVPIVGNNISSISCISCCDWSAPFSVLVQCQANPPVISLVKN